MTFSDFEPVMALAQNITIGLVAAVAAGVLAWAALPMIAPAASCNRGRSHPGRQVEARMELMAGDAMVRGYDIALGFAPDGDKAQEGDGRTPEGRYVIDGRNPASAFHRSLKISYPDKADRAVTAEQGIVSGGDIFIHGAPNWWLLPGQPPGDWTKGCIAVPDAEIEEIWLWSGMARRSRSGPEAYSVGCLI